MIGLALRCLWGRPLRSLLTMTGVVCGVGAVVAMLAIGEGAQRDIIAKITAMGTRNIILKSRLPQGILQRKEVRYGLTDLDVRYCVDRFEEVAGWACLSEIKEPVRAEGHEAAVTVWGASPEIKRIRALEVVRGRFLTPEDERAYRGVCVLSEEAVRRLAIRSGALDLEIRIGSLWCKVVGVTRGGESEAYVPFASARAAFGTARRAVSRQAVLERVEVGQLYLMVKEVADVEPTMNRLKVFLKARHKEGEVELVVPLTLLRQEEKIQRTFQLAMGAIAGIALLVGGIGIMNMMLSNVSERVKEIGTRRALGASQDDILRQFLIEAVVLTMVGALVGLGFGVGVAKGVAGYVHWPVVYSWKSLVVPFLSALLVGVASGAYPAYQASRLDPIQALRSQ